MLVVREKGRGSWDLPGGGIDHGEDIRTGIARELREELNFTGNFTYTLMRADDPARLFTRDIWQLKLIYRVVLNLSEISTGEDAEEIAFITADTLKDSAHLPERMIYEYAKNS